jgi:hypothetical protein
MKDEPVAVCVWRAGDFSSLSAQRLVSDRFFSQPWPMLPAWASFFIVMAEKTGVLTKA